MFDEMLGMFLDDVKSFRGEIGGPADRAHQDSGHQELENLREKSRTGRSRKALASFRLIPFMFLRLLQ